MRVHASTRFRLKPGTNSLTAHAELLKSVGGGSELLGTAESISGQKAFLLESTKGRDATNAFYTKNEGIALKESSQIPQTSSIWIGRLDEVHRAITGTDFTRQSDIGAIRGIVTTLTNEHFVAQIVSLHLENPATVPTQISLEENRGEWDKALTTIWLPKHITVNWPPGRCEEIHFLEFSRFYF